MMLANDLTAKSDRRPEIAFCNCPQDQKRKTGDHIDETLKRQPGYKENEMSRNSSEEMTHPGYKRWTQKQEED